VIHILALCIGVIAGLRIFLPLTALAWAGHFDWLLVGGAGSVLAWPGIKWLLTALSIGETLYLLSARTPGALRWYRLPLHMVSGAAAGATVGNLAGVTAIGAFGGLVGGGVGFMLGIFADRKIFLFTGLERAAVLVLDAISLVALLFIAAALS
jgi:uncharacterized membrane protein